MKKLISILILALGMSLFAYTENLQPREIKVGIEVDKYMTMKVNCTYEKHYKYSKYFRTTTDINDLMEAICKDTPQGAVSEISYGELAKRLSDFREETGYIVSRDSKIYASDKEINYKTLSNIQNQKLTYHLNLYKPVAFGDDPEMVIDLSISSFTNMPIKINHTYLPYHSSKSIELSEQYMILNYKYDLVKNKIETFELDKQFKDNSLRTFINSYDIDNDAECINGYVWIKKYGAKTDDKCSYKEINNK